jgi:hypothetical protein
MLWISVNDRLSTVLSSDQVSESIAGVASIADNIVRVELVGGEPNLAEQSEALLMSATLPAVTSTARGS